MNHSKFLELISGLAFFLGLNLHAQGHGHLDIGALGVSQGDPLSFVNGADFAATSGYVKPGTDPYGHLHGRRFTATKAGTYQVAFHAFDTSTNGSNAGPIHSPSAGLVVTFQAGVLVALEPNGNQMRVRFVAPAGNTWQLEFADSLDAGAPWTPMGEPVIGGDYRVSVTDGEGTPGPRFYRLKTIMP